MNQFGLESVEAVAALTLRMTFTPDERRLWEDLLEDEYGINVDCPELMGYPVPINPFEWE